MCLNQVSNSSPHIYMAEIRVLRLMVLSHQLGVLYVGCPRARSWGPYFHHLYEWYQISFECLTVIWTNGVNIFHLQDILQQDLINNKLSIDVAKCKALLVHGVNHLIGGTGLQVRINNEYLECVSSYKYLGIYLDTTLSFNDHVEYMKRKVNKRLVILCMSRTYMKPEQCTTLYKSLVLPLLDYGDIAYMNTSAQNLESLQIMQNRACRIILRLPRLTPL